MNISKTDRGEIMQVQAVHRNIIFATGRVSVDKDTPNQMSAPFSQIQYCEPDEMYKAGSLFFPFIRNGYQLGYTKIPLEHMNIRKRNVPTGRIVEIEMLDTGKIVEVHFLENHFYKNKIGEE